MPFGQHGDTELRINQFPETKISGLPVSRRMRGLVYMASRDKVDVDTFHKGIQYALEKLGKSKFGFERTAVSNFKSKRHEGSGNELVDYSKAPCLGADQKARGLWERDWGICKLRTSQKWEHPLNTRAINDTENNLLGRKEDKLCLLFVHLRLFSWFYCYYY